MAGDWIKMRTDISIDPRVIVMAETLRTKPEFQAWCFGQKCDIGVTQRAATCVVIAALLKVWGLARSQGKIVGDRDEDILLQPASLTTLDVIADLTGFGDAMQSVGWAEPKDAIGVMFPNCAKHIYSPDEIKRKKDTKRQREHRGQKCDKERDKGCDMSRDCHKKVAPTITNNHTGHIGSKEPPPSKARRNGGGSLKMVWGKRFTAQDLMDDSKLDVLFGAVVRCGFAHDTDEDRQRFAALVFNIRRQNAKQPFGLLTTVIQGGVKNKFVREGDPTNWRNRADDADHDRARRALKQLDGIDGSAAEEAS